MTITLKNRDMIQLGFLKRIKAFLLNGGLVLLISYNTGFSQSLFGCNKYFIGQGGDCIVTVRPQNGMYLNQYYIKGLEGLSYTTKKFYNKNEFGNNIISQEIEREYWIKGGTVGSYIIYMADEPDDLLADAIRQMSFKVYYPVGSVSISGTEIRLCQSVTTSTYSASASNADSYSWSIDPATSGTINGGSVSWNIEFVGTATVRVNAIGAGGDVTTASLAIIRDANQTFTAEIYKPAVVCEGEQFTIGVITSHSQATYAWYEDDSQNSIGSTAYLPVTPQVGTFYRVTVTPSTNISCLINTGPINLTTRGSSFRVKPRVNSLSMSSTTTSRCNTDTQNSNFTATANDVDSYQWSISPGNAGTLVPNTYYEGGALKASCAVVWNNSFAGQATVSVTARGCGTSSQSTSNSIRVSRLAATPSLANVPSELCLNEKYDVNLSFSEADVNYQLFGDGGMSSSSIQQLSPTSWRITGPGRYTIIARDAFGNCSNVISEPHYISETITDFSLSTNSGTLTQLSSNKYNLEGCLFEESTLTASGEGSSYQWYLYDGYNEVCGCMQKGDCWRYFGNLHPDLLQKKWDETCLKLQKESSSIRAAPGWAKELLLRFKDACNITQEKRIQLTYVPLTFVKEISPDLNERVMGAGTTQFKLEYTGTLAGLEWQLIPTEAGSISTAGLVTWNPSWSSFLGNSKQPAIVKAKVKQCSGWEDYVRYIDVYPVLDADENRIRMYVTQRPYDNGTDVFLAIENPTEVNVSAGYFDGLGRNVINTQYFGVSSSKDLVELKIYDQYGRESIKKLPYSEIHSLNYQSQALERQQNFYQSPPTTIPIDPTPYSETIFEPSPLNRVIKQGAPGTAWQPDADRSYTSSDHSVKFAYEFNEAGEVFLFKYDAVSGLVTRLAGADAYYPANQLYANKTKDGQNNEVIEYVDKEGRTICKKVQYGSDANGKLYASTYYVYDDLGNLVIVLPPEAVKNLTN